MAADKIMLSVSLHPMHGSVMDTPYLRSSFRVIPLSKFRGFMQELGVESQKKVELIDITERVKSQVNNNTISDGICIIYIPHPFLQSSRYPPD